MQPLVFSIVFAGLGLSVLAFILYTLWHSFFGNMRQLWEKWSLSSSKTALHKADKLLITQPSNAQIAQAISLIHKAFSLKQIYQLPASIMLLEDQQEEALARVLSLSEIRGAHLNQLPELEKSLQTHRALLSEYAEVSLAKREVLHKQAKKGRETPGWAVQEFSKKLVIIKEQIRKNRKQIFQILGDIFSQIESQSNQSGARPYH